MNEPTPRNLEQLPGIERGTDEAGRPWLRFTDWELFDFVQDRLVEEHDLEELSLRFVPDPAGGEAYVLTFALESTDRLHAALSELDPSELRRILARNARAPGSVDSD